jgi:hypothetical protein
MRGGASGSGMSDEAEWRPDLLVQSIRRFWKDDTVVAAVVSGLAPKWDHVPPPQHVLRHCSEIAVHGFCRNDVGPKPRSQGDNVRKPAFMKRGPDTRKWSRRRASRAA